MPIEVVHASEVITMNDSPSQAFRKKKDSSAHVATKLVRDGIAQGLVSAGNTGAVMAVARFGLGTLPSVDRPALAAPFPTARGGACVLLDVGANVDSKPAHLVQFAIMGEIYYRAIFGTRRPRVGLLSIGEEESKGNELTREAHTRLKHAALNFVGNVEGRDIFGGSVDVIACDGFIGNVALKISEGLADAIKKILMKEIAGTFLGRLSYPFLAAPLLRLRRRVDYAEFGGAPLLGVNGICMICHGRSSAKAIKNAIRRAKGLAESRLNELIQRDIEESLALHQRADKGEAPE